MTVPSHGHPGEGPGGPAAQGCMIGVRDCSSFPHMATIPSSTPGAAFLVPSSPHRRAATGVWGRPSPDAVAEAESRAHGVLGAATVCCPEPRHGDRDGGRSAGGLCARPGWGRRQEPCGPFCHLFLHRAITPGKLHTL